MDATCAACKKAPPAVTLKNCAKCKGTLYCSRDCQKADWKVHKKVCGKPGGTTPNDYEAPPSTNPRRGTALELPVADPFSRLVKGTYLHGRPEADVYRLLIDAYRLRLEDDFLQEGKADPDSVYAPGGAPDGTGLAGLQKFLTRTAALPGMLPPWWDEHKKQECEQLGVDSTDWSLLRKVTKSDIIARYGDDKLPMQLRMLAEAVYGRGPGGANGRQMMEMMATMERQGGSGANGGMHYRHFGVERR